MPPKKSVVPETKPLLGRFGTSLKCGIVGIPNVGKSTFFNVLCKQSAAAENYPFCTIDPNESRAAVPDERFDWLCEHWKPASKVPAYLSVLDIAGLVKGASEGAGLGNAFLSHISSVDGILHMVRAFENKDVTHVDGEVDPIRDLEVIHEELRLKDIDQISKIREAKEKDLKRDRTNKKLIAELETIKKVERCLVEDKKDVRSGTWTGNEIEVLNSLLLLTSKPMTYLVNVTESDYIKRKNKWLPKIKAYVDDRNKGDLIIPWSGELESKLFDMGPADSEVYCKENNCQSALPKIIKAAYKGLNLQYFFTAGADEVRAWTIRCGDKAPEAAGKIHTDFERGFIMAEVMKFTDYKEYGSEAAVKAAGKYAQQGKNYVVGDGDIIFFKFNVTAPAKKK